MQVIGVPELALPLRADNVELTLAAGLAFTRAPQGAWLQWTTAVQNERVGAELVGRFARYIAQAHECVEIAMMDAQAACRRDISVIERDRFDGTALLTGAPRRVAESVSERVVAVCHVPLERSALVMRDLERFRNVLQFAPAGLLWLSPAGPGGRIAPTSFARLLTQAGLRASFAGDVRDLRGGCAGRIAIFERPPVVSGPPAPPGFRVLAVMPAFNEEDIIEQTLAYLTSQGIEVHLLDNWSTDRTVERARRFLGKGLVDVERFPAEAPPTTYDLTCILHRVEEIAARATWADWIVLHDVDERRCGPFEGASLRDALWRAEHAGYSCIDHVTLNFWPVDDAFDPQHDDMEAYFRYFEFSDHPGHFHQRRAWRRGDVQVALAPSAGHNVQFERRRIYPYKFLLKHYPIRSRAHGIRKVLHERRARLNPVERAGGWHLQYEDLRPERFVRDRQSLLLSDPTTFADEFLLERLSGVGVFDAPPSWATPPRW